MRTIRLVYSLESELEFVFEEYGDLVTFKVNGTDRSEDGDAIEAGLVAVLEGGHDLQRDISVAFDAKYPPRSSRYQDPDYRYESRRDEKLFSKAEGE